MQVYAINFHGEQTRDGYWTAGVFSDKAKADRICAWLNELMKLNHKLWMLEIGRQDHPTEPNRTVEGPQKDRTQAVKTMADIVGQEGYYEVVAEEVFDTAVDWMKWHSTKNPQGFADWPDVADIESGLQDHDPSCPEAQEAQQLRQF